MKDFQNFKESNEFQLISKILKITLKNLKITCFWIDYRDSNDFLTVESSKSIELTYISEDLKDASRFQDVKWF